MYINRDMKYTVDDILALRGLIHGSGEAWLGVSLYADVIHIAQLKIQGQLLSDNEINELLKKWLEREFKSRYYKICTFLFNVEFHKVPLYINNRELDLFFKWRIRIEK